MRASVHRSPATDVIWCGHSWDTPAFRDAIKATGEKNIILSGLRTEVCITWPTLNMIAEGYNIYVVEDACAGTSEAAHVTARSRITVPTMTETVIKAWSDRALDTYRLNLSANRPAVPEAAARVGEYFAQRGQSGPELEQQTATVLGGFATVESAAFGFRIGLRFFSLMMLILGLPVALALWQAARGLRAPPGAGYV